mmetsp:Transcript_22511/g.53163  ORF Transcript_22511/g.53163 Transcript_22511/m.53163 type:complete len:111 (+) Transcript_22511:86-418(+)
MLHFKFCENKEQSRTESDDDLHFEYLHDAKIDGSYNDDSSMAMDNSRWSLLVDGRIGRSIHSSLLLGLSTILDKLFYNLSTIPPSHRFIRNGIPGEKQRVQAILGNFFTT